MEFTDHLTGDNLSEVIHNPLYRDVMWRSIGVATAGFASMPASIRVAGMLSPPRLARTTTSAAA